MRPELSTAASMTLTLLTIAAIILVWGGVTMIRKGDRTKGVLMIVCALVLVGNVLIWTV
ncbi:MULTISPECIES: hypothetical protein [unclassified Sphingomonas]|uniref:hypothetical protein n=1 Tax=unclassified Sphingomonas TaxID=196159 RepID=UPI002151B7F5|nr:MULTISPECIES: hypothetical protein [unclassified Sphingomonas]MCR5871828.1 hypothetical protein [Sphingomonas sp. J344]UUX99888.1 hypothetical protein LRS08_01675 [Sphingomonas sp. J315]